MKNIFTLFLLTTTIFCVNAQIMTFSLVATDKANVVAVNAKAVGGDINSTLQQFEMFIRIPSSVPVGTVSVSSNNTVNFDQLSSQPVFFSGANNFGSEVGFTNFWFRKEFSPGGATNLFVNDVEYEMFRINFSDGAPDQATEVEIAANSVEDPFYIVFSGSAGDLIDLLYYDGNPAANLFYGDDVTNNAGINDGQSYFESVQNVALPITLRSFTASSFENRDANLDWTTASEINASHFTVERSDNGIDFEPIGKVNAAGNTLSDKSYTYIDRDVNVDRSEVVKYYRLKLVDVDGEYKYSGIRVVNFTREQLDFELTLYPNPTNEFVQIRLSGVDNTVTERPMLHIYDTDGSLIQTQVLDSDLGKIDMADMPSRLYHFMITYKGVQHSESIMKM